MFTSYITANIFFFFRLCCYFTRLNLCKISLLNIRNSENTSLKVNNRNTRTMFKLCSKLTITTKERRHWRRRYWRRSFVFIVNFEQISHYVLVFLLLILKKGNAGWVMLIWLLSNTKLKMELQLLLFVSFFNFHRLAGQRNYGRSYVLLISIWYLHAYWQVLLYSESCMHQTWRIFWKARWVGGYSRKNRYYIFTG